MKLDPFRAWKSFGYAKNSTERPLERLAYRLLSVCANSASCERLFSTFGLILTKLRSRMGNKLLLSLAELKLHIRDEHCCSREVKERLKRHFSQVPNLGSTQQSEPSVTTPNSAQQEHPVQSQTHPSQPAPGPTNFPELYTSTPVDNATVPQPQGPNFDDSEDHAAPSSEFQSLSEQFDQLMADEATDPPAPCIDATQFPDRLSIPLIDLLDFKESNYWSRFEKAAEGTLSDEMELCEMLDNHVGDVEGRVTLDMDESTETILPDLYA